MTEFDDSIEKLSQELDQESENQKKIIKYMTWSSYLLKEFLSANYSEILPIFDYLTENYHRSSSQNFQDLIVCFLFREETDLYFCEVGACDGIHLSNSYLLEKKYGWSGIVVEPNPLWHQKLQATRDCEIDIRPIWSSTGLELEFALSATPELSTILEFVKKDSHAAERTLNEIAVLESVSLEDLLKQYSAPQIIHFLSVDTEGSEYEILKDFNFESFEIFLIVVEHNFTNNKVLLKTLLEGKGFTEILTPIAMWDSWFVQTNKFDFLNLKFIK